MEEAIYNVMYKTSEELKKEREEKTKALDFYQDNWDKVSDKYWEVYGDTLSKEFYIDNLDEDEIVDFIEHYFDGEY